MKKAYKTALSILVGLVLIFSLALLMMPKEENLIKGQPIVKETVKIGYKGTLHYLPVMVAKEKGFFEQEGIDAELINFESSNQAMDAVLSGSIDMAFGNMVLQFNVEQKQAGSVKAFLISNESVKDGEHIDFILVRKNSTISSAADLKGKKIATNPGSTSIALIKLYLKAKGIEENEAEILTAEQQLLLPALESGQFDAIWVYEPQATIGVKKGIAKIIEEAPVEKFIVNPWTSTSGYISAKFLQEKPETAAKAVNALTEAVYFIRQNPDEARKIISKYTPIKEDLVQDVNLVPYLTVEEADKEAIQRQADIMYESGVLKGKIDTANMLLK